MTMPLPSISTLGECRNYLCSALLVFQQRDAVAEGAPQVDAQLFSNKRSARRHFVTARTASAGNLLVGKRRNIAALNNAMRFRPLTKTLRLDNADRVKDVVPTVREIAKACGCNNSTVSRALSNKPFVSPVTRERILRVAQKMGWKPNPLVSAYMAHFRSTQPPKYQATLAYVISFANEERFEDLPDFMRQNFYGAQRRAASLGYVLEPIWLRELNFDFGRLAHLLKSRGIPGAILHGGKLPPDAFCAFDCNSFVVATWGYSIMQPRLHRAAFHWTHGIRMVLQKIRQLGYHRIALIISKDLDHLTDHCLASTFYGEKHYSHEESLKSLVFSGTSAARRNKVKAWLDRHRPEVIIGTREVRLIINEMQWRIPEDIAYVSPHWSSLCPEIGGIDQRPELLGANSVDLVVSQLMQNERGIPQTPKLLLNEGCWMDGKSISSRDASRPEGNMVAFGRS